MKKTEKCHQCNDDYIPTRRGAQKFCSSSCRSRNWFLQQKRIKKIKEEKSLKPRPFGKNLDKADSGAMKISEKETKQEGMTMAGTAESFLGAGAANLLTQILTNPATKSDINELKTLITGGKYLPVRNMDPNNYGEYPYYDIETGNIVYIVSQ